MENRNWKKYYHFFLIFLGVLDGMFASSILSAFFPHSEVRAYAPIFFLVGGGFLGQIIYKKVRGNILPLILSIVLTFALFYTAFYVTYFRKPVPLADANRTRFFKPMKKLLCATLLAGFFANSALACKLTPDSSWKWDDETLVRRTDTVVVTKRFPYSRRKNGTC